MLILRYESHIPTSILTHSARIILPVLLFGNLVLARETDQFTTPRAPLNDLGPKLSRKVVGIIEADRTGEDPELVLSRWDGRNFLVSRLVRWINKLPVAERPFSFRPSLSGSIFRLVLAPLPISFFFDAPTVRVHGYYLGADVVRLGAPRIAGSAR